MQVLLDDYGRAATLATELVNTVPEVWDGADQLADPAALVAFLAEHAAGISGLVDAAPDTAAVAEVHAVRGRVLDLLAHPAPERLVAEATELTGAVGSLSLAADDGRARWTARARVDSTLAERIALACGVGILGVVRVLGPDRFRPCADETCSGVFIDVSRPGRRRYCMPELCGNRVNVAAHRARRAGR